MALIKNGFADLLEQLKEDVVTDPKWTKEEPKMHSESNYTQKKYTQTIRRGFECVSTRSNDDDEPPKGQRNEAVYNYAWEALSTICHGLLGGMSLAHLIIFWPNLPEWSMDYLDQTAAYTQVFYFLATISFVSSMDSIGSRVGILLLIAHLSTLILTLVCESYKIPNILAVARSAVSIFGWFLVAVVKSN